MTGTACDEVEARARVYRARMARAFVSWCGARFGAKGEYGEWGTQEADPFATEAMTRINAAWDSLRRRRRL